MLSSDLTRPMRVVVIGGANIDIKLQAPGVLRLGTSNPGSTRTTLGGVARNIAENLARLGARVRLMTAVGDDDFGRQIIEGAVTCGIDTDLVSVGVPPTGTYAALLDGRGRMISAVSSLAAIDAITAARIEVNRDAITWADAIICDCNLAPASILRIGQIATNAGVNLFVEGVSTPKVVNVRRLLASRCGVAGIFVNQGEIEALTGGQARTRRQLVIGAASLHDRGVVNVVVGLGRRGAFVSRDGPRPEHGLVTSMAEAVVDVTGAGDAAVAATVWALQSGASIMGAVRTGQAAAAITVASQETVSPALTPAAIRVVLARMVP